jgi:hypothetical protein
MKPPGLAWILAYLAMLALVVGGLVYARQQALAVYGSEQAQADWDQWRGDSQKMSEQPSPVRRRPPRSTEPPALVLMRDHFAICLGLAVVLSSVLFGTFMFFLRGVLKPPKPFVDRSFDP